MPQITKFFGSRLVWKSFFQKAGTLLYNEALCPSAAHGVVQTLLVDPKPFSSHFFETGLLEKRSIGKHATRLLKNYEIGGIFVLSGTEI
jgi:hypothetical protein